jgi:hypothetical protein
MMRILSCTVSLGRTILAAMIEVRGKDILNSPLEDNPA